MFRRKNYETRVDTVPLPTELWIIILDIVIEEGIIRLDQCDYTTFPHMESTFTWERRYQFYDSYWRLRLVCRRFNTLLGARPWQSLLDSTLLPFPITTRALNVDCKTLSKTHFQYLLAETSACGRLVYIDVTCDLYDRSGLLNLSDFLRAGRAFRNVQRLTLRFHRAQYQQPQVSFWTHLHRAFPYLVTLAILPPNFLLLSQKEDEAVCFERLEILYFEGEVVYSGCHFPRLRHASVWQCTRPELEILMRSPDLESLLIRSYHSHPTIDVSSCLRLKLLGFPDYWNIWVVPFSLDHPVEHIWIYSQGSPGNPEFFKQLSRILPKITRITVEFLSSSYLRDRWRLTDELRGMRLDSFGLTMRPLTMRPSGVPILVIERPDTVVTDGILKKVWKKMRR